MENKNKPEEKKTYSFDEKVKSMTASEIIMAMVNGLRKPVVKVNMATFGDVIKEPVLFGLFSKKVCYGCAATNTICEIFGGAFDKKTIREIESRADTAGASESFIQRFEFAIDSLRKGQISTYNTTALGLDIATIDCTYMVVPLYSNSYTEEDLESFVKLAETQPVYPKN